MPYQSVVVTGLLALSMHTLALPAGAQQALPVRNGRPVVATIDGASVSLDELVLALGPTANPTRLRQGQGTAKDLGMLDRLVTIKLVVQEAARMGLDEAPEIRSQVEVTSREILRELLFARLLKGVTPDPAAVEKLFRESVREWKTGSLLFQDEAAARRAQKELAGGAAFKDVAARAVAAKAARADADDAYHAKKDYLPQIAEALATLQPGQVGSVIRLPAGFVVVKVMDIRYPANPAARAEARQKAASQRQASVLDAHDRELRRQFVVVNKAVLNGLDYEAAKPGVDALLRDRRVVAQIRGGASVTVADLTDYLRMQFFHGTNQAAQHKQMNAKKEAALDATLGRRLLNMEALKLGLDKTTAYADRVRGFRESLVFDSFVQKVIVPGNKMREDEVKGYYNGHLKDYSYPEMMRVRGLAFAKRDAAEAAVRKLREGTDFAWLAANAAGQVAAGAPGLLTLDGQQPITTSSMPKGLQRALAGSKAKDVRLYASPEGHVYALAVQQVIAPSPKPYDEVREEIAKKLYGEKLKKGLDEYVGKLRARSKVAIYLKRNA